MKRVFCICLLAAVLLCGCNRETAVQEGTLPETSIPVTTVLETTVPETTAPETTVPEETEPETTESVETEPEHSDLYLYYIPVEDVITWYNEVVLDTEFEGGGDATLVQKWEEPIRYYLHGAPTEEDIAALESFATSLNFIEGFPGISPADFEMQANLHIHFTDEQGLLEIMGQEYTNSDGAVTFWYDTENRIYSEVICIRTELDQELRNSVILEEIYNGLGPVQDTLLRPDSIIYQEYAMPQELTQEDWLLLRLLYHPDMRCGMDAAACEAVIRSLYY